jgi:hypothetical protein
VRKGRDIVDDEEGEMGEGDLKRRPEKIIEKIKNSWYGRIWGDGQMLTPPLSLSLMWLQLIGSLISLIVLLSLCCPHPPPP